MSARRAAAAAIARLSGAACLPLPPGDFATGGGAGGWGLDGEHSRMRSAGSPSAELDKRGEIGPGRRIDPQYRHASLDEVLEEVPVVASHLDHQARPAEGEPLDDHVDIGPGMRKPAVGIGRQVRVLGEDPIRAHVLLHLDQEAPITHVDTQRIEGLHRRQTLGRHVALAQRRHAEVDEGVAQRCGAEAACGQRCLGIGVHDEGLCLECRHTGLTEFGAPNCRRGRTVHHLWCFCWSVADGSV
jgi:hypothetical protein